MTPVTQLVLAGGGHSHALVLQRWAMRPKQRPKGLITLVNRSSTTLYSGMVPGLIAGLYTCDQVAIDLRRLADEAGVIFVQGEIQGLDLTSQTLRLEGRLPLPFTQLSLDVGAISRPVAFDKSMSAADWIPIKPLEPALAFLESQDGKSSTPFHVVGSGLAGVEVALALRHRWPTRSIHLLAHANRLHPRLAKALQGADVRIVHPRESAPADIPQETYLPGLICSGSRAPSWLAESGLPCCPRSGRVNTNNQLQVIGHPTIFASGDCALIETDPRPPSGVWAVRASINPKPQGCLSKPAPADMDTPATSVANTGGIPSRSDHRLGFLGTHRDRPPPTALALEATHRPALHATVPILHHGQGGGARQG